MSDLITRLSDAIIITGNLCAEIKKTRHVGHSHTQLDLLEASLASAPSLPSLNFPSSAHSELEGYMSQMGEINARLEHIAHPKKHSHNGGGGHGNGNGNGNGHHHHHQKRHEHKEMEDPHFGDLRVAWEAVRDGVEKLVEGKGDAQEQVTEHLEAKLEIKEEVKAEETKVEETKAEGKTEVKTVEEQDVAEVKVSEVEEAKTQQNEHSEA